MAVRERLSREAIVTSALALADAEGLEAVTIRRLAQDQGVTPMALYWHFKDKDLLLDGVAERLLSEVRLPPERDAAEAAWHERLDEFFVALLDVLRAHPAVADLVHQRFLLSEPGLRLAERAFSLLSEAGFDPEQVSQIAIHALHSMVLLVTTEPGRRIGRQEDEAVQQQIRAKKAQLMTLAPERYPHLILCADEITRSPDEAQYFEFGRRMLLAGICGVQPTRDAGPGRQVADGGQDRSGRQA